MGKDRSHARLCIRCARSGLRVPRRSVRWYAWSRFGWTNKGGVVTIWSWLCFREARNRWILTFVPRFGRKFHKLLSKYSYPRFIQSLPSEAWIGFFLMSSLCRWNGWRVNNGFYVVLKSVNFSTHDHYGKTHFWVQISFLPARPLSSFIKYFDQFHFVIYIILKLWLPHKCTLWIFQWRYL